MMKTLLTIEHTKTDFWVLWLVNYFGDVIGYVAGFETLQEARQEKQRLCNYKP